METKIPVVVGEAIAGQAAKVTEKINTIIKSVNDGTFDLIPLLHEAKKGQYYLPLGFDTFGSYAKSLAIKITKAYYLSKIGAVAEATGITRPEYEKIGIAKLRVISKLELFEKDGTNKMYDGLTMCEVVKALAEKAADTDIEDIEDIVDKLQGKTEDDARVWLNIAIKKSARDTVQQALDLMKLHIGTVSQDADGKGVDASDGRALELICADWLSDPNNNPNPVQPVTEIVKDGEPVLKEGING